MLFDLSSEKRNRIVPEHLLAHFKTACQGIRHGRMEFSVGPVKFQSCQKGPAGTDQKGKAPDQGQNTRNDRFMPPAGQSIEHDPGQEQSTAHDIGLGLGHRHKHKKQRQRDVFRNVERIQPQECIHDHQKQEVCRAVRAVNDSEGMPAALVHQIRDNPRL